MNQHTVEEAKPRSRWLLPGIGGLLIALVLLVLFKPVKVLPYERQAPAYSLVDQNGETVSAGDLHGRIVLVNFMYTNCPTICPAMIDEMKLVADEAEHRGWLGDDLVLVTMTFDPERDTPEQMLAAARQAGADPDNWLWLTGDPVAVKRLVGGEFGVYFKRVDEEETYDFVLEPVFVLIDWAGNIRAEYRTLPAAEQILRGTRLLVREKNAGALGSLLYRSAHLLHAYP